MPIGYTFMSEFFADCYVFMSEFASGLFDRAGVALGFGVVGDPAQDGAMFGGGAAEGGGVVALAHLGNGILGRCAPFELEREPQRAGQVLLVVVGDDARDI